MITNIEIDGFKSLEKVNLEIKPITLLIGLNSSGKSSVLQVLQILKQSVEDRNNYFLIVSGSLANLGSFKDIVSKTRKKKELKILIGGSRNQNLSSPFSCNTEYGYDFTVSADGIMSYSATLKSGSVTVDTIAKNRNDQKTIEIIFDENPKQGISVRQTFRIGIPFEYMHHFGLTQDFDYAMINQFLDVIQKDLKDFRLVPAIRGITCPDYPLADAPSDDLVDSLNLSTQAQKLSSTVVYDSTIIEQKINRWIKRITGVTINARTVPSRKASIEATRKYVVNLVNEGFGTNQLVHLFTTIVKSPDNSIIGIEEPEVHLHPKAQSELAKVLIEIVKEDEKNLLLTTHSEHILYRVLIEIAKGTLKKEDIAIYHFKLSKEGVTQVERLKPDEKGRLKGGIPDFLETDLDEFKEFLEVLKG